MFPTRFFNSLRKLEVIFKPNYTFLKKQSQVQQDSIKHDYIKEVYF